MSGAESVTVVDVVQAMAAPAAVLAGLRAPSLTTTAKGPAYTCSCAPGDNLAIHAALVEAPPGSVVIADAGGRSDGGYFGELMALDASKRGLAGAVVVGSVRDIRQIEALRFPLFFKSLRPESCVKERVASVGEPIHVDGVGIATGDMVLADADGIVIVEQARWPEVHARAMEVMEAEAEIEAALRSGRHLADVLSLAV
jgi:4-hydroxy-4-methyl-2-oxoglutarate aldolase